MDDEYWDDDYLDDDYLDDDHYVEFTVVRDEPAPMAAPVTPHDFLADVPPPKPSVEPNSFAHNGFHVDEERPLSRSEPHEEPPSHTEPDASSHRRRGRHWRPGD